jgi:hypothetical protein
MTRPGNQSTLMGFDEPLFAKPDHQHLAVKVKQSGLLLLVKPLFFWCNCNG